MNKPIVVFGARGQVGREIVALAAARGLPVVGLSRQEADITNEVTVRAALDVHRPAVAVNAAGYTAVDRSEREPEAAVAANVTGPAILAGACAGMNVPLVQLSCEQVFDGNKKRPYVESDKVSPVSVFGRTKAEGEAKVRELAPRHVILRTSWIYGPHGRNFLRNVMRLAAERDELRMVGDQTGCPTATIDIAEAVLVVARKLAGEAKVAGTFHFAGNGATNWFKFASEIVQRQAVFTGRTPKIAEIRLSEYPAAVKGGLNCELDSTRFRNTFGYTASPWNFRVAEVVASVITAANRKAAQAAAAAAAASTAAASAAASATANAQAQVQAQVQAQAQAQTPADQPASGRPTLI